MEPLRHLAGLGYPAPRVLWYDGPALLQDRVHGPRMTDEEPIQRERSGEVVRSLRRPSG